MTIPGFVREIHQIGSVQLSIQLGGDPDGPPVLLWHGFLGTSYVWRHVGPLLAARGYSVIAPDMRGYGDSQKPYGDVYDGQTLVEDFRGLIASICFGRGRPLLLVAHDMGAPAALLWAALHPREVAGLAYLEEPVLLPDLLKTHAAYTPEGTKLGGLWWWFMALAPDAVEALIADGRERAFLCWFFQHYCAVPGAIDDGAIDEYLRSFSGRGGVSGAFGVYRCVLATAAQTAPLARDKVRVPVLALGGEGSQGSGVFDMVKLVADRVEGGALHNCGHFIPEEQPAELVARLEATFRDAWTT